jgi:hypothetical protein
LSETDIVLQIFSMFEMRGRNDRFSGQRGRSRVSLRSPGLRLLVVGVWLLGPQAAEAISVAKLR